MLMYFEEPAEAYKDSHIVVSPNMMAAITVNGVAALVLGVLPSLINLIFINQLSPFFIRAFVK